MFKRGETFEFDITEYAYGGKGISKITKDEDRTIVFIPNTYPGQKVKAIVSAKRKRHAEAKLIEVIKRSAIEEVSDFQEISGAPYIYVPVHEQEKVKQSSTLDAFSRLSGITTAANIFDEFIWFSYMFLQILKKKVFFI